jgi:hypothetical protein
MIDHATKVEEVWEAAAVSLRSCGMLNKMGRIY